MTYRHYSTLTCDRCGTSTEVPGNAQPEGWKRLMLSSPPLASPLETTRPIDVHLCIDCVADYRTWYFHPGKPGTLATILHSDVGMVARHIIINDPDVVAPDPVLLAAERLLQYVEKAP